MTAANLLHILPLIVLAAGSVVGMLAIAAHRSHNLTFAIALLTLVLSFLGLHYELLGQGESVAGLIQLDGYAAFFTGLMLVAGIAVTLMARGYMGWCSVFPEECYLLILIAVLGCAVLVSSIHFVSFFLGLELLTVSLYVLIAYCRSGPRDIEAGLKYFIPAATSSAFLLFGMSLIYAQTGTMLLPGLVRPAQTPGGPMSLFTLVGAGMILTAIGFKLALAPFHLWAADVYEGSPDPVTALVATASKGAVFALLLRYFGALGIQTHEPFLFILTAVAILTMFLGNLLALLQNNLKRLLAYSSISHLGYLLIALMAGGPAGETAAMFYLLAYFITILGAFGVMVALSGEALDAHTIVGCRGLASRHPFLGAVLALMMFSLAGIPLTAGFLGKFYVVLAGAQSRLWLLVLALVVNSVLGLFYYLRVVIAIYQPIPVASPDVAPAPARVRRRAPLTFGLLAALVIALIWLGVYPGPAIRLIESLQGTLR
ncbi:MAG: NADH-quinone oxidoreductase subunit N [Phycisphaerales bacterium]